MPGTAIAISTPIWQPNARWELYSHCCVWNPKVKKVDIWECVMARKSSSLVRSHRVLHGCDLLADDSTPQTQVCSALFPVRTAPWRRSSVDCYLSLPRSLRHSSYLLSARFRRNSVLTCAIDSRLAPTGGISVVGEQLSPTRAVPFGCPPVRGQVDLDALRARMISTCVIIRGDTVMP
jgi:hypothetical protein